MRIDSLLTEAAISAELGQRLRVQRLDRNSSQAELADRAGVALSTLQKLEAGGDVQLSSLLRVLRALDLVTRLDGLVPEAMPGPIVRREMEQLAASRTRRRASRRRGAG